MGPNLPDLRRGCPPKPRRRLANLDPRISDPVFGRNLLTQEATATSKKGRRKLYTAVADCCRNPNFRNSPNFPEKIANPPVVWRSAALCAYRPRNLGAGWPIWNPKFRAPLAETRPKRATATSEDTAPRRSAGRKTLHRDVGTPTLKRMSPKPGFPEFLGKRGAATPKSEFPDFPISFRETRKSARRPEIGRFLGSPL